MFRLIHYYLKHICFSSFLKISKSFSKEGFPCLRGSEIFIQYDLISIDSLRYTDDVIYQNSGWSIVQCIRWSFSHSKIVCLDNTLLKIITTHSLFYAIGNICKLFPNKLTHFIMKNQIMAMRLVS